MKRRIDHYSSFRDPAAKVFCYEDAGNFIYRELSPTYLSHYHHLVSSGLAKELIKKKWLVSFDELSEENKIILKAEKILFVSYPYEWTFNQWKDAALLTLKIQYQALKAGMILKDASPFNIVFNGPSPVLVDISSFEIFKEGTPWQGFKQFSESFYLPLLLHKYFGSIANKIFIQNINGIPLSQGLPLLPLSSRLHFNTQLYLSLPEKIRRQFKDPARKENILKSFSVKKSMQFADQLFSSIKKLKRDKKVSKWNRYYDRGKIDVAYLQEKEKVVKDWFRDGYHDKRVIDFGCNTGHFSTLLAGEVHSLISFDEDIDAVDELYLHCRDKKIINVFPFCADISQPTPAVGFNNNERDALISRLTADTGIALALIHHLVFTQSIHFEMAAAMFARCCKELIIEFIPKEDDKVQLLLSTREDIFGWYNLENFREAFGKYYQPGKTHRFTNNRLLLHFTSK